MKPSLMDKIFLFYGKISGAGVVVWITPAPVRG